MRTLQFTLLSLLFASFPAYAGFELNMPAGITPISNEIYNLHMTVLWVCVVIGIIVFGTMIYSIIYHRKSKGAKAAHFHEHLWVEIAWTVIPFFILVSLAIPGTLVLMNMNDENKPDVTIKITGFQWKWKYEYLDQGISFFSNLSTPFDELNGKAPKNPNYLREVDHPLVVPVHKKIRFLLTSNDVIHAWWVPELGVKRDAVPGFINETWARINKPGTYRGQCAELCGMNHALMPIVVVAMSEQGFNDWVTQQGGKSTTATTAAIPSAPVATQPSAPVAAQPSAPTATAQPSAPAATAQPSAPSGTAPPSAPSGTAQPSAPSAAAQPSAPSAAQPSAPSAAAQPSALSGQPSTTAPPSAAAPSGTKMSKDELMKKGQQIFEGTCAVCHKPDGTGMPPVYPALKGSPIATGPLPAHLNRVLNGKPGTAMQAFRDQFSDADLAAVITYERNSFGNHTGDAVQPDQIEAAKKLPPTGQ